MTGRRIGGYRLIQKIGQGGMGEVYKAQDTRLRRLVAIKALRRDQAAPPEARARFLLEARAASALSHPNVVQIHELESQDGDDFIVMEFVEGRTLAEILHENRLSVEDTLDYGKQMAAALAAAHAAGIVHRDIKPGNIIVTNAGVVKVLDFGLARRRQIMKDTESTVTAGPRNCRRQGFGHCFLHVARAGRGQSSGRTFRHLLHGRGAV